MKNESDFAIYYHPEGYTTTSQRLMGRHAAGESFLRGLLCYGAEAPDRRYSIQVSHKSHEEPFRAAMGHYGRHGDTQVITTENLEDLSKAGGLYIPGPGLSEHAFHRRLYNDLSWSLCGITHTTSSAGAMDSIASWITSPVQPWDAVICTSTAVKKNVEVVLQAQIDEMRDRLGITQVILPLLPVIPLGVHTQDFQYSSVQREAARARISAKSNTLVVLYTGRLSFHAKAHPLAMYQALENAARITDKEVVLVECGWHANDHIEKSFADGASMACPSVRVVNLDGREVKNRETAWASADIFCSLSDNIQETFGIVPIEAMAAGLPVVVSDWDGYKDTVRDGVDGFRVPTLAPRAGLAGDLAHRHAVGIDTYDMYCGHASSLVAVNAVKLTQAFVELFKSPPLRKQMGEAGRLRAAQDYDWRTIIPRYEELWSEQSARRHNATITRSDSASEASTPSTASVWPARLDPTIGFANYPTMVLDADTELKLTEPTADAAIAKLEKYKRLMLVNYASFIFPKEDEIRAVLCAAESYLPNSVPASTLIEHITPERHAYVLRGLVWLCKLGLLEFK